MPKKKSSKSGKKPSAKQIQARKKFSETMKNGGFSKKHNKKPTSNSKKNFKSKSRHSQNKNMAKKKSKSHSKSMGSKIKIPVVGKYLNNPTVKKVALGAGTVALAGAVVQLINQPQLNSIWGNQIVRSALAYSAGDITGAIGTYVLENPSLLNGVRGNSASVQQSQVGFA